METITARALEQGMPRVAPWSCSANSVIHIEEGLIGFSEYRDFVVAENEEIKPFYVLQSTKSPEIGFLVIDPSVVVNDYYDLLPPRSCEIVGLTDAAAVLALVICSIGSTPRESTGNFLAPLIINHEKMIGRQLILTDSRLSVRQSLL